MKITKEQAQQIDRSKISSSELTEEQEMYKENIIDYYKHPRNKEELKDYTCKHRELNPICGDEIILYLKIEKGKVKRATYTGKGCAISQASISLLTEKITDMNITEAKNIKREDIFKMLGIPISFVRTKCALLSLKTLTKSLEETT
ncbi:iron-sulfur cluster assembly scaffold protein [Candidatus Woesearchaeota archaeon]|nr:iron-sulfur cluster assembly scaffold protein [Candidatus Woesearchaeota archaeon]